MRIYSNKLTWHDLYCAMQDVNDAGFTGVWIQECTQGAARKYEQRFDVALRGMYDKDKGRTRRPNTRMAYDDDEYAATWMEWGWFIAVLFRFDPEARVGIYNGRSDFLDYTNQMAPNVARRAKDLRNFMERWKAAIEKCGVFGNVDWFVPPKHLLNLQDLGQVDRYLRGAA